MTTAATTIRWSLVNVVIAGGDPESRREVTAPLAHRGINAARDASSLVLVPSLLAASPAEFLLLLADPHAEAVELVRRLRVPGAPCPHIPIMVLTPDYNEEEVTRWIRLGADYICKVPIASYALMDRIERLLANPIAKIAVPTYIGPDRRRCPKTVYSGPERRISVRARR